MSTYAAPLKIHLRLVPDLRLRSWRAEAEAIDANSGGGVYRLTGFSPYLPIAPGDVIRAEIAQDSALWMTELIAVVPNAMSMITPQPSASKKWMTRLVKALEQQGCESFQSGPMLLTKWPEGRREADIVPTIDRYAPGAAVVAVLDPEERHVEILESVMTDRIWLQAAIPEDRSDTGYWVGDDQRWTELGVSDPDLLAYVQSLATQNPRVLATLRAGLHENVLHYVERLTTDDPASLPPLDGPLLVDPDSSG